MKKILRRAGAGLLLALALLQFWHPPRNVAPAPGPNDLNVCHPVPAPVLALLRNACYDCHSNHTRYPWYAAVQPVRWWLDSHINDGKRHLNFSEFGAYTPKRALKKLEEVSDEVTDRRMPLRSYTWMHPAARLTPAEIQLIAAWAEGLHDEIPPP